MKKFILMAAVMLSSMTAFAQHPAGSFTVQPKVGLNIASFTNADGSDPRLGLAVGAELEYAATDMLGISAGVLYSMQGCKATEERATATIKTDYINIPILANVYVVKGLAVKVGVQPGFKVNSGYSFSAGDDDIEIDDHSFKSFDFSIPVGLSYEYNNVVLDARYNFGCTKVLENFDPKNSVFQITLGYKFNL
jgi:hypothetical protein